MKKSLLGIIMCLGLMVVAGSQETKAIANGTVPKDIKLTKAERARQKDIEALIQKINRTNVGPHEAKWTTLDVPYVKQKNAWFCGPSTTLQTERYFDSLTSATQDTLAKELGTTTSGTIYSNIKDVLNKRASIKYKYQFIDVNNITPEAMGDWLGYAIHADKPPVLNVAIFAKNTKSKAAFGYLSNGHFMNASGVYGESTDAGIKKVTQVQLTDSFNEYGNKLSTIGPGIVRTTIGVTKTIIDNQPSSNKGILW